MSFVVSCSEFFVVTLLTYQHAYTFPIICLKRFQSCKRADKYELGPEKRFEARKSDLRPENYCRSNPKMCGVVIAHNETNVADKL